MDIEELSKQIKEYHEEDKNSRWMNLGLIAGGFALATASAYPANPHPFNAAVTIIFFILGVASYLCGACCKRKD